MRTRIKVADLSLAQWGWLNVNLPATREFVDGAVRMCVEFEVTNQISPVHVEMPPREFVALIERLAQIDESVRVEELIQDLADPDQQTHDFESHGVNGYEL